jgi:hypothetical protein
MGFGPLVAAVWAEMLTDRNPMTSGFIARKCAIEGMRIETTTPGQNDS